MSSARSEETRRRLLEAATEAFAAQGFHRTPTRTIAQAAGANIALIHYHFGDKAGLYRAIFSERLKLLHESTEQHPLPDDFAQLYPRVVRRLLTTPDAFRRLVRREEIEPTGLIDDHWLQPVRTGHERMQLAVCRELGLDRADLAAQRLTYSLAGMATVFTHHQHMIRRMTPAVFADPDWIDQAIRQLTEQAMALLHWERARRRQLTAPTSSSLRSAASRRPKSRASQ